MSRDRNDLLKYETDKYDLMFSEYDFARDPDRKKHIDYMLTGMDNPDFSEMYTNILYIF